MSDRKEEQKHIEFTQKNSSYFLDEAKRQLPHPDPEKNEKLRKQAEFHQKELDIADKLDNKTLVDNESGTW